MPRKHYSPDVDGQADNGRLTRLYKEHGVGDTLAEQYEREQAVIDAALEKQHQEYLKACEKAGVKP